MDTSITLKVGTGRPNSTLAAAVDQVRLATPRAEAARWIYVPSDAIVAWWWT